MFFSPEQCHLSICLKADGFYFLIAYPPERRTVYERWYAVGAAQNYFDEFKEAVYAQPLLLSEFANCSIVVESRNILVCPPHFTQKGMADFYRMSYGAPKDELYTDISHEFNVRILYSAPHALVDFLKRTFFYQRMNCLQSLVLEALAPSVVEQTGRQMFARLYGSGTEIYLFENGLLHSITDFAATTTVDRLYYLLNSWQERGMDQLADPLFLFGEEEAAMELCEVAQRYLKKIELIRPEGL